MDFRGKLINNRFIIVEKIDDNLRSEIYRARDIQKPDQPVWVQILRSEVNFRNNEDTLRFIHNVQRTIDYHHPNLIETYAFSEVFGLHCIVSEYVNGESLRRVCDAGPHDTLFVLNLLKQICEGLEYLHQAGVFHGELCIDNIYLVDERIKIGGLWLPSIRHDYVLPDLMLTEKSFLFRAPEQNGMINRPIGPWSDLYSLGVIGYKLLSGKHPFDGGDFLGSLHRQIAGQLESIRRFSKGVSGDLDRVIMKLLEKEPDNRYQTARGVLADLKILQAGKRDFLIGLNDRPKKLNYRTRMIGRTSERKELDTLFQQVRGEQGAICFIHGNAGVGKTRLVEDFAEGIRGNGNIVIQGKCLRNSGQTPFYSLQEALNQYVHHLKTYPKSRREAILQQLRQEFGTRADLISRLNPELAEMIGDIIPPATDQTKKSSRKFYRTVQQFFIRLSLLEKGLIILLDDIQWADWASLHLIADVGKVLQDLPFAIICTYRDGEEAEPFPVETFFQTFKNHHIPFKSITLQNLEDHHVVQLLSQLFAVGQDSVLGISRQIYNISAGNPFFTIEIIRQFVEEGIINYSRSPLQFNIDALRMMDMSPTVLEIILKRIGLLSAEEKEVLSAASAIGNKFDLRLLAGVCRWPIKKTAQVIDKAIQLQLLINDAVTQEEYLFFHDKIQEAFYSQIEVNVRKDIHRKVAICLEDDYRRLTRDNVIYTLAHHFIEAGDTVKAVEYAYQAGMRAYENFAHDTAAHHLAFVLQHIDRNDPVNLSSPVKEMWLTCQEILGCIALTTGESDRAIDIFYEIKPYFQTKNDMAKLYQYMGEAYIKKGDWSRGEQFISDGLAILGEKPLFGRRIGYMAIVRELVVRLLRLLIPVHRFRLRSRMRRQDRKIVVQLYNSITFISMLTDLKKFIFVVLRSLDIAEKCVGPSTELTTCHLYYAMIFSMPVRFNGAKKIFSRAIKQSEALNDEWGKALALFLWGGSRSLGGDTEAGLKMLNQAVSIFDRIGDLRHFHAASATRIVNHIVLANFKEARAEIDMLEANLEPTRDTRYFSFITLLRCLIALEVGDYPQIEAATEIQFDYDFLDVIFKLILGRMYQESGEYEQALTIYGQIEDDIRRNRLLLEQAVRYYIFTAECRLSEYLLGKDVLSRPEQKQKLRRARKAYKVAVSKTRPWVRHHGSTLRLAANLAAALGKDRAARKRYEKSIIACERYDRKTELMRTYYDYALFLSQKGEMQGSRESLFNAYQLAMEAGVTRYINNIKYLFGVTCCDHQGGGIASVIDSQREAHIQYMTRIITGMQNASDIFHTVLSNVIKLCGAQNGYIFIADKNQHLQQMSAISLNDNGMAIYSKEMVEHVFESGVFAVTDHGTQRETNRRLSQDRQSASVSVLSVPIRLGKQIIGVCHLENPFFGSAFSEEHADLVLEIFSQSESAIEKAISAENDSPMQRPEDEDQIPQSVKTNIEKTITYINENYSEDLTREDIAAYIGISPNYLGKHFKSYTGQKIGDYINSLRITKAAERLKDTSENVTEIAYAVGFSSLRSFYRVFQKHMNITAKEYRKSIRNCPRYGSSTVNE